MHKHYRSPKGFTIVELLIVVVVISIMAAISVVTYSNIKNKGHDSVIQSDLRNFAKKAYVVSVETDNFPVGGARETSEGVRTGDQIYMPGFKFQATKSSYDVTVQNLHYCTGPDVTTGEKMFRVQARSKSGNTFLYSSKSGITNVGDVVLQGPPDTVSAGICEGIGFPRSWSYGYYITGGVMYWWNWVTE